MVRIIDVLGVPPRATHRAVARIYDVGVVAAGLVLEPANELVIKATQSISDDYLKKPPLKIGEGIAGKVVEGKKPITIFDISKDKFYKYKEIAKKEGLCSLLCVPLVVKNKAIGAIDVYTSTPHKFTEKEEHILTAVANQAAIVIENTELLVKTKMFW